MNLEDIKFKNCKYKMSDLTIKVPGMEDYQARPKTISSLLIEKDYDAFNQPYFEIALTMPSTVANAMRKNCDDVHAYVHLEYCYALEDAISTRPTKQEEQFQTYLDKTFYVFLEDSSPDTLEDPKNKIKNKDISRGGKEVPFQEMTSMRLLLYNEDYFFGSRATVNEIHAGAPLLDSVIRICNQGNINNVLMSPPSGGGSKSQLFITPIPAIEQLDRLCNKYGLHNSGTMIFLDFENAYILEKSPKCTAWRVNENKKTYFLSYNPVQSKNHYFTGCFSHSGEKYNAINVNPNSVTQRTDSLVTDQIYGNTIMNYDERSESVSTISSGAKSAKKSVTKSAPRILMTKNGGSPSGIVARELSENSKIVDIRMEGVNVNMLNPNLEFIMSFTDPDLAKINGSYRISKMVCAMQKDGNLFIPTISCTFKG